MNLSVDFISACRKLIAIDSTPENGTREVAEFAAELCREAGLFVEIQNETLHGIEQANLIARPINLQPPDELMLQTHLDTVDPGNFGLWTKTGANPFNASIYQDTIYGLGSAEVKLDFLCKLVAISSFKNPNWRRPPVLVGTYGEELGMAGAVKIFRKKKVSARMALVGEPTELRLVHAGKGLAVVEIEIPFSEEEREFQFRHNLSESSSTQSRIFLGKSAHSSEPHLGESAILKMFEYLAKLPEGIALMEIEGGINFNSVPAQAVLEFDMVGELQNTVSRKLRHVLAAIAEVEKEFGLYPNTAYAPPTPTLNIGMIRTHEESVKIQGCCRVHPSVNQEIYEGWMERLRGACEGVGGTFHINDYKQPFRTEPTSPIIMACQDELKRLQFDHSCCSQSVSNEANVLTRFGVECAVIGPGRGVGNSHSPDEHVKVKDLNDAIEFYKGVIQRMCL